MGGREGIEYIVKIHIVKETGGRSAGEGKGHCTIKEEKTGETTLPLVLCLDILVLANPATSDPSVRVAVYHILALPVLG